MKVGIDFSINSPGICIEKDNDYIFYGGIRLGKKIRKIEQNSLELLKTINGINIFYIEDAQKSDIYNNQEKNDLEDAIRLSKQIIEILRSEINGGPDNIVGIEGFSYNSLGSSNNKIYGYGYILRYALYNAGYDFKIMAPKSIKKTAGNGNYNKLAMINAFLDNKLNDSILEQNRLRLNVINNIELFKDSKNYFKPFEDMVDSYWVLKSI